MQSAKPRSSSPPGAPRTCTLRTRFAAFSDLERTVAVLVQEDGRVFVPLAPGQVTTGEHLKVAFTTIDGAAAVHRMAIVESLTPDVTISNGEKGVVLRVLAWQRPPLPDTDGEAPSFDEPRNPLAGVDTNMVTLLVECSLTESTQDVSHTYDDIPCVELPTSFAPAPEDGEPTRRAVIKPLPPLAIAWHGGEESAAEPLDDEDLEELEELMPRSRWRPAAAHVLIGGTLGMGVAFLLVVAPRWAGPLLGRPLPAMVSGLSASIGALDGLDPLPPILALARRAIPPLIPAAALDDSDEAPAEEAPVPATPATCQVRLLSQPSHVEVWSGDRRLGHTPMARLAIPCGTELILKRPRYQPTSARVPEQPGDRAAELAVHLARPTARLAVTSVPAGAEVRIHGQVVGQTPTTVPVSRYVPFGVEVRAPHFYSWKKRLYIRNDDLAVQADLAPRSGGRRRESSP